MPLTSPFVKTGMSGGGGFGGLAPNSAPVAATSGQVNNFPAGFPGGGGPASGLPGGAGNPVTVGTGNQRQQSGGGTPGAGQVCSLTQYFSNLLFPAARASEKTTNIYFIWGLLPIN